MTMRPTRTRLDLTQTEFAGLLGLSFNTISRCETGQSIHLNPLVLEVCNLLGQVADNAGRFAKIAGCHLRFALGEKGPLEAIILAKRMAAMPPETLRQHLEAEREAQLQQRPLMKAPKPPPPPSWVPALQTTGEFFDPVA